MRAVISPCGQYRYRLERETAAPGAEAAAAAIIMVNPSTADHKVDDPTIRKCIGFAERHGFGRIIVGNLFAYRATDIKDLRKPQDPIGPENDDHLLQILRDARIHIVAWGAVAKLPETMRKRWQFVVRAADRMGIELHNIGLNDDGHPKHPLTTGYEIPLTKWDAPWFPNRHAGTRQDRGGVDR